jgi:hypothetical protein
MIISFGHPFHFHHHLKWVRAGKNSTSKEPVHCFRSSFDTLLCGFGKHALQPRVGE